MTTTARTFLTRLATLLAAVLFVATIGGCATTRAQAQAQAQPQGWSRAELEQLLAPVALYPDAMLAQLLIAATYPDEIVEAAAWSRRHPTLAGEDAVRAADDIDWDPSVKSLLAFPGLLDRMDEHIDWTRALGEAFLAEEESVIEAVQALRRRARIAGSLASDGHVHVLDDGSRIHVAFASPAVVYLPYYDPRVVYGRWWWPTHPPVVWTPWPGYRLVARGSGAGLWWGPGVRLSVGFFFGGIDWPRRQVHVVRIDTWYVHSAIVRRAPHRAVVIAPGRWRHERTRGRGGRHPETRAPQHQVQQREVRRPETPAIQRERARPDRHERTRAKPQEERRMSRVTTRPARQPAPALEPRPAEARRPTAGAAPRDRMRKNLRRVEKAGAQPRRTTAGAAQREAKRPEPKRDAQQADRRPDADTPSRQPGARGAQRRGPQAAPEPRRLDAGGSGDRRPQG